MNKLYTSVYNWNELRRRQTPDDPVMKVELDPDSNKRYTSPLKVRLTFENYKQCSMFALKYGEYL